MKVIVQSRQGTARVGAAAACLLGLAALAGCAAPPPPAPAPTPVSYDGRYTGTLQILGAATGMNPQDCATDPRMAFEVKDNKFAFVVTHPRIAAATPDLRGSVTIPYHATIAADGSITGISDQTNTTMLGSASGGNRLTGQIYGLLCYYSFTAQRV
jgi:hypothetical protein